MTRRVSCAIVIALFCALALPAWGQQYYLYQPKSIAADNNAQAEDGILVTEVPVKKGDTLSGISRKFSGRGMYYPQILLFNKIDDPNLIYAGDTLKVPVTHDAVRTKSAPAKESSGTSKKIKPKREKVAAQKAAVRPPRPPQALEIAAGGKTAVAGRAETAPAPASAATAGQKLFERALTAYKQNDCRTALELFDRYLADGSSSPLAADASLYKADCYLKLSSQ